jgi:hypothetical protein
LIGFFKHNQGSVSFRHHHTTTNPFPLALAQSQYQFALKPHFLDLLP